MSYKLYSKSNDLPCITSAQDGLCTGHALNQRFVLVFVHHCCVFVCVWVKKCVFTSFNTEWPSLWSSKGFIRLPNPFFRMSVTESPGFLESRTWTSVPRVCSSQIWLAGGKNVNSWWRDSNFDQCVTIESALLNRAEANITINPLTLNRNITFLHKCIKYIHINAH